ncbi:MAG: hypothetical protein A3K18_15180 [Lentisphaerae bacterium RIFOXYA12_64_32]|nr:MAG: hypothetical protein A3K18_15180 [Lentisphaerae bacterium RIFOXYA12_64_32]
MSNTDNRPEPADRLRQQAEEAARGNAAPAPANPAALSPEDTGRLVHELRVHQIELETQNEELRRIQAELEASRTRYFDLYDLAPVGYVTLSDQGLILEANLTAAKLLGVARGALVKQPLPRFVLPEDQDIFSRRRKQLLETGAPQVCELRMLRQDGSQFWACLEATTAQAPSTDSTSPPPASPGQGADGPLVCRVVMSDITARKRADEEVKAGAEELAAIYQNVPVFMLLVDGDRRVRKANASVLEFVGRPAAEMIGRRAGEVLRCLHSLEAPTGCGTGPHCRECTVRRTVMDTLETGQSHKQVDASLPLSVQGKETVLTVLLSTSKLTIAGQPMALVTMVDITARKQAEEELRERTAALETFNQTMLGRETRIIELKEAVNRLCVELGRAPAYPPVWQEAVDGEHNAAMSEKKPS